MFHVELRQFPHVARAFNLSPEELHARIVSPWVAGQALELEERRWSPQRAKLAIYQARELAGDEIGMGRGWGTVSREGEDVTEHLLTDAQAQRETPTEWAEVKGRVLASLGAGTLALGQVVDLVGEPTRRLSERLGVAEQVVWELLHEERVCLIQDGNVVPRDRWQPVILAWESWGPAGGISVRSTD